METLRPPEGLKLIGNVDSNWRHFKQQFELYMSATGMDNKPEPRRIALLLTVAGPQAIEVFNTFEFASAADKEKYNEVIAKFEAYCSPKKNIVYERFLRMPFGIISASEIYHCAMDNMLEGLEGVRCYIDDLVIWGSTLQEHNDRLAKVLQRISDHGLKLNRAKCQFCVQEMTFLGDKLSGEGIEPDDRKIQAILSMPRPRDKKGVLRVMGMINFIGKFIPNLSAKTSALRELLRDSTEFKWTTRNEREWNALKEALTKSPVLAYYDPAKRQKISTDASKDGLGAVLLQAEGDSWKPVAYASRSMTTTETKYAQIEKECLGLAYGLERFHCYVYGLPTFTVETDHRPLVSIIKKNLNDMSPRIQRLIMKLQRYDFELIYTPGKHLVLADALSRAPVMSDVTSTEKEIENHINMIVESLPVSDVKAKQISEELDKDKELQAVINNMLSGWPRGSCPKYYHIRAELSVANGLLLRDNRIVIPHSLRPEILRQLHEGHLGIEKCKRRARGAVYWPGINKDIEDMVGKCETCNKYQSKQAREPMMIPDLPTAAWEKVGTDLFHCNGKDYLLVIDYYSNFPEIALLSNTTASTVIGHVKSIFARHGIPKTVVSDNGPCYNCKEWQQFANHYGFSHVTSSPQHAQANGKSEKGVHIIKQILKKTTDIYRVLTFGCSVTMFDLKKRNSLTLNSRDTEEFRRVAVRRKTKGAAVDCQASRTVLSSGVCGSYTCGRACKSVCGSEPNSKLGPEGDTKKAQLKDHPSNHKCLLNQLTSRVL
ncbi:Retrovirus-related Pol polyprotein [Larimichthys crocea]|uniref:Gypsy retrotransposon integrase-like protein 1 n=1 Tax=Larimichthys crocea TaxID=215358 RepID=A0A6G0HR55_LARCR|nr:Retrovirus-related Pol polyprotein [Larimichthys crocea]